MDEHDRRGDGGKDADPAIRLAGASDVDEIARLRWEFSREEGRTPTEPHEAFTTRFGDALSGYLASGRWSIWVAEAPDVPDRLVGVVCLQRVDKVPRPYPRAQAWGYVTNVYVVPAWRNSGLGRRMLETTIAAARAEGLEMLILWPSSRAIPFYERLGFTRSPAALELPLGVGR